MKKTALGLVALTIGIAAITADTALAYRGDLAAQGPNYSTERHIAMTKAFENNDYLAWKNLMQGRGRVSEVVTEANFARFAEAHKLALEGKTAEAQKIREELGLNLQNGSGKGRTEAGRGAGMNRGLNR